MTKPPKKWKMAVIVWLAIYPTITILYALMGSYFELITPMPLRTLATTVLVVPLMVFSIMPALQKLFQQWLNN
jgi:antibiotic biosynthesis monooxygenase (ABM) superfamily enzyme